MDLQKPDKGLCQGEPLLKQEELDLLIKKPTIESVPLEKSTSILKSVLNVIKKGVHKLTPAKEKKVPIPNTGQAPRG